MSLCAEYPLRLFKRAQHARLPPSTILSIIGAMGRKHVGIVVEYIRDMWLRSALTSLLAAIVLCVSCLASTCALNCEMSTLHPAGHTLTVHHSETGSEAVPDHCGSGVVPQTQSNVSGGSHGTQIGQQCGSKPCAHDQAQAVNSVGYQLDQPTAVIARTVTLSDVRIVVRLPNHGVSDLLPKPPPRYLEILRL